MTHNDLERDPVALRQNLPAAAQRWLESALPPDPAIPTAIRIEQEGEMDIRGKWTSFEASGVYQAPPLAFNWRAKFRMMPGVWIVAEDGHREGRGWGSSALWGLIPMGKRTDPEVLACQVVRNLGELPLLPPFALVDPGLKWSDAGEESFEVRYLAGGREHLVRFEINQQGDVVRAYSPARVYDVPGGYAEAPWYYEFSDHQELDGMRIPTTAHASFEKSERAREYFRGRITAVSLATA